MPETTSNTVQVLTAGGAGAPPKGSAGGGGAGKQNNNKRRNRGRRHRGKKASDGGTGTGGHSRSSEDEMEKSGGDDQRRSQQPPVVAATTKNSPVAAAKEQDQNNPPPPGEGTAAPPSAPPSAAEHHLEIEEGAESGDEEGVVDVVLTDPEDNITKKDGGKMVVSHTPYSDNPSKTTARAGLPPLPKHDAHHHQHQRHQILWLFVCFFGIMASFVCYGLLLEYTTSGGRKLHELSFLFVTSSLYTLTAAAGRYVRDETPTTIPPARFAILGLTSMGSTFCSVRSLRYVIFPIQVLAKSCKPVPVMLMGALMGKRYPVRKYINVVLIVLGVALFMGGGDNKKKNSAAAAATDDESSGMMSSAGQLFGILLLFVSLCFDGGTGAYEDKLMSVYQVQPFDLMFNIQLGKTILAGIGLLVLNQLHIFKQMIEEMGFLLVALGLTGAMGQIFIFVTIAKFGALTCSIIGLARKVTTLVASIYFYGHSLNAVQFTGLAISIFAMISNFWGKKKGGGGHGHGGPPPPHQTDEELQKMLGDEEEEEGGDLELAAPNTNGKPNRF